jgi:hypothetical protein
MKKTIQLVGFVFALAILNSCYTSPDLGGLSSELVVATDVDLEIDFKDARLADYYISDSIVRLNGKPLESDYIFNEAIINEIASEMNKKGYTRLVGVNPLGRADIVVIATAISITNTGQTCSGWWGGYPGYAGYPWYGGGYYPYCSTYSYDTGRFVIEMLDNNATPVKDDKLNLLWTNVNFGTLNSNDNINENRILESINQAFAQSPYLTK